VTLNGQALHGVDSFGHFLTTQLEGYFDSAPPKLQDTAREWQDGDYDLPVRYGSRPVTIGGRVICASESAAVQARNRLAGLVQGKVRLQVMDQGEATWADVKLTEPASVKRTGRMVRFQYHLKAPDARRYGNTQVLAVATGSPIGVSHRGTYNATPSFIVRGDMPGGWTLTVDGWDYTVTRALVTGAPHRVDYNNGRLYVNGTLTQGNLGNTNRAPIPPGVTVGVGLYPVSTGSGSADMTITDTFI
jgi:hypothetical protein